MFFVAITVLSMQASISVSQPVSANNFRYQTTKLSDTLWQYFFFKHNASVKIWKMRSRTNGRTANAKEKRKN